MPASIAFKETVSLARLKPAGAHLVAVCGRLALQERCEIVITSANDNHATGAHPRGEAVDVRTRDWTPVEIVRRKLLLEEWLGPEFLVLYEVKARPADAALAAVATVNSGATAPHIHLQLRKGFGVWPRPTSLA